MDNAKMIAGRYLRWAQARRKLAWITARIAEGRTVYLSTSLRRTKITKSTLGLVEARKSGLYVMIRGRTVCYDHCKVEAT